MVHFFKDFAMNTIKYRPRWVEVTKGANVHKVRDDEGLKIFRRQGWTPTKVCYVRLYGGHVDTGAEYTLSFAEFEAVHLLG